MARSRRCHSDGCTRWATADSNHCSTHNGGTTTDPAPPPAWTSSLLSDQLAVRIRVAGEDPDLQGELSVLRWATAKVMTDLADDPIEQARLIARLCAATAQVARTRRQITGDSADSLTSAITQILTELGDVP